MILTSSAADRAKSSAWAIRGLPPSSSNALSVPMRVLLPPARINAVIGCISRSYSRACECKSRLKIRRMLLRQLFGKRK